MLRKLTILQEPKIKQATRMASAYITPEALEGRTWQIYVLDRDDQINISEDETRVFKLHERFA